jgi:hypothetical protein
MAGWIVERADSRAPKIESVEWYRIRAVWQITSTAVAFDAPAAVC